MGARNNVDDFRENDRVWDAQLGWGIITEVSGDYYPVGVAFDGKPGVEWFSTDGKIESNIDVLRTLFFEEIPIPESAIQRPWTPEPGEWVAVSVERGDWHLRKFVKMEDGLFICKSICGRFEDEWDNGRSLSSFNGDNK